MSAKPEDLVRRLRQLEEEMQKVRAEMAQSGMAPLSSVRCHVPPETKETMEQLQTKTVKKLLEHVVKGEQKEAKIMVRRDCSLAVIPGDVTDLSGREFKEITAFQYAVWALDWHMWTMIRREAGLLNEEVRDQLNASATGDWVSRYGICAKGSLNDLIKALREQKETRDGVLKVVAAAQSLVPVHVIHEYYNANAHFKEGAKLMRSRNITKVAWHNIGEQEVGCVWGKEDDALKPFINHYHFEEPWLSSNRDLAWQIVIEKDDRDIKWLTSFRKARIEQWEELITETQAANVMELYVNTQKSGILKTQIEAFLSLVATGKQQEAECMLQDNSALVLCSGPVQDHLTKRTFENITAFQYAVWALDWHMWRMLQKYLPDNVALEQITGQKDNDHVDLSPLIQAYEEGLKHRTVIHSLHLEIKAKYRGNIGRCQQTLPAHVINEFCHPERSFAPCPDFRDPAFLPRSFAISGVDNSWHCQDERQLDDFIYGRSTSSSAYRASGCRYGGSSKFVLHVDVAQDDLKAFKSLYETRRAQRCELFEGLRARAGVSEQVVVAPAFR